MTKIDIFSGFLGAGKTTLIKKLISAYEIADFDGTVTPAHIFSVLYFTFIIFTFLP